MKRMSEFRKYFETVLKPELSKLETERKRVLKRSLLILGGIMLTWIGATIFILTHQGLMILFAPLLFIGICIAASVWREMTGAFARQFKINIITKVAKFLNPNLAYSSTAKIKETEFKRSKIFQQRIDCYDGEDMFKGRIGKADVRFCEICAQTKAGGRQNNRHEIFSGLFFVADFNKKFRGFTVVLPGIEKGTPHSLRHFFVSLCANNNVPERVCMTWVGHKDSEMVRHYYHLHDSESKRAMKELVKRANRDLDLAEFGGMSHSDMIRASKETA